MSANMTLDLECSFGNLRESVLVAAPDRRIVFANKAAEDLLKRPRDTLIGATAKLFFADPALFDKLGELYRNPEDKRHKQSLTLDIVRGDGTTLALEAVSAPLFDPAGKMTGLFFLMRDLSERKELERRLNEIAYTLEDALDAISEGFAIYDHQDRLVICNDNYREIYEASAPAMFPGNRFEDILRFGLNKKQYDTGEMSDEEWLAARIDKHQNADGSIIEQQLDNGRWLRISETRTSHGGIVGIRADITELKKARAQAESAFKKLSLVADTVTASITEVDENGICVFVNKVGCVWFDAPAEQLIGTRLRDRLPWNERNLVRSLLNKALRGAPQSLEAGLHFPDGVYRECQIECNPRLDADGKAEGLVVLINDISEKKKTEQALAELYGITSTRELSHDEKIREILRLGTEHFELPYGIISHVTGGSYSIIHAHSPNGELVPGTVFELEDTYCAITLEADSPVEATHLSQSVFCEQPHHRVFALETYIGAPILVDGVVYGTINFTAPDVRKREFSPSDLQIIRQFADWIGNEIARQRDHLALMSAKMNLERVASIDDLTQIFNRRAFLECATREVQRYRRTRRPFTVVMMDIDKFKQINDLYGHAVGDIVLRKFADTVSASLRSVDIFGRVGGEEFCVILNETDIEDALQICDRLRKTIIEESQHEDVAQTVTCSMGLATTDRDDIEISGLMQKADTALYEAKKSGRNKCIAFREQRETVSFEGSA